MLDFCLLHYLLSPDNKVMTLFIASVIIPYIPFFKLLTKNPKILLYLKVWFCYIGIILWHWRIFWFIITVVEVIFISLFILQLKNIFFRWGSHIYMSLFPSVHPFVHPSVCLSICQSIHLSHTISQEPNIIWS